MPSFADERQPWGRQPGEPPKAWAAFARYRDLPPARPIHSWLLGLHTYRALYERAQSYRAAPFEYRALKALDIEPRAIGSTSAPAHHLLFRLSQKTIGSISRVLQLTERPFSVPPSVPSAFDSPSVPAVHFRSRIPKR